MWQLFSAVLTALSIAVNKQTQDLVFPPTDKAEITRTSSGSGNTILDRIGEGVCESPRSRGGRETGEGERERKGEGEREGETEEGGRDREREGEEEERGEIST